MILQTLTTNTIIGVGLLFGLSFLLNVLTYKKLNTFIVYMLIIDGLLVSGNILPLWTLILLLISTFIVLYMSIKKQ